MKNILDFKKKIEIAYDNFSVNYDAKQGSAMISFTTQLLYGLQIPKNPIVLDVGCGTGIATFELMKKTDGKGTFYGIDLSQKMINLARKRALECNQTNVEFSKGNAEKIDYPESSFDLIVCNQVFHWIINKKAVLKEMFRVLKPNGKAALAFQGGPSFKELFEAYNKVRQRHPAYALSRSPRSPNLEETRELFKSVGFEQSSFYQIQKKVRIPASFLWSNKDLTTSPWKIGVSLEKAEEVQREIRAELQKKRRNNWDQTTLYYVFGIGTKKN